MNEFNSTELSLARARPMQEDTLNDVFSVKLTRADIALIVDAILKAEMALHFLDNRHDGLVSLCQLREQQLSVAFRLEDLMVMQVPQRGECR